MKKQPFSWRLIRTTQLSLHPIFHHEPEEQSAPQTTPSESDTPMATITDVPPPTNLPGISMMEEEEDTENISLNEELPP